MTQTSIPQCNYKTSTKRKDLLGIADLEIHEIEQILDIASYMKAALARGEKKSSALQGLTVLTLFYENSTRTRVSFELAAKFLGAQVTNIAVAASSVAKGETLLDTGRTLDAMGTDILVIRHNMSGAPHFLAKNVRASVINAGDGMHEHPSQALLDIFTIKEALKRVRGLRIAIIGDILHSRVARSNILCLVKMGAEVRVGGPSTLIPHGIELMGAKVCLSVEDAVSRADVVMSLRVQMERQKKALIPSSAEYARYFGLNDNILGKAKSDVLLMHPGPVNRGLEMSSTLVDSINSVIETQVSNGVAVRMALLKWLAEKRG